jgi:DNA-binding transcriptional MerR regulator
MMRPVPKKKDAPVDKTGLLRIGELAKLADVARGTIQHYLREGLLPKPVKTTRNMAYYDPSCVDRIRAIKELQSKSYLPLAEIRELLGEGSTQSAFAQAIVHAQDAALKAITPAARSGELTLREAAKQFGLRIQLIEQLAKNGLISASAEGTVHGIDLEVLAAISKLKTLGFTEKAGFKADDLLMYQEALQELLQLEVHTFMRALQGKGGKGKSDLTPKLARSAVEGATMLLVALRKKSIIDLLGVAKQMPSKRRKKKKR